MIKESWIIIFKEYLLNNKYLLNNNFVINSDKSSNFNENIYMYLLNEVFSKYNKSNINDLNIIDFYNNENFYPKFENIFRCFNYFELDKTKVVLLGQDPYHQKNQAIGLSFGINVNLTKVPPSLKNIAKELKNDLNIELEDYSLEKWANQGVLLLNSALSVQDSKPSSHNNYWCQFTQFIITKLNNELTNIIFVAWGAYAYNLLKDIDQNKHTLLISSHPSPLSCYKKYKEYPAFNNSKIFSKINDILLSKKIEKINF